MKRKKQTRKPKKNKRKSRKEAYAEYLVDLEKEVGDRLKPSREYDRKFAKAAANWIQGPVMEYLDKHKVDIDKFPIGAERLKPLIGYVEFTDLISFSVAKKLVFPEMLKTKESAWEIMERLGLIGDGEKSNEEIIKVIDEVLTKHPDELEAYKGGKKKLFGMFMGKVMNAGKGKLDPKGVKEELTKKLES